MLTVIDEEFVAAKETLGARFEVADTGAFAPVSAADDRGHYPFVLSQCADRSNIPAATSARNLLELFRPEIVLLVGVGGGIVRNSKGPSLGDVVVGKYIHYASFAKDVPTGKRTRYFGVEQPALALSEHAQAILHQLPEVEWWDGLTAEPPTGDGAPTASIGEIVGIEHIAGNPSSADQSRLLETFDTADAVDMESVGVARALHEYDGGVHYRPRWIAIRGVSDHVTTDESETENNAQRAMWKPYAAQTAAHFARKLIERVLRTERGRCDADGGAYSWTFPG